MREGRFGYPGRDYSQLVDSKAERCQAQTRRGALHHDGGSGPMEVASASVPASVPKLDRAVITPQQTPTKFRIKNGPEILDFRPIL